MAQAAGPSVQATLVDSQGGVKQQHKPNITVSIHPTVLLTMSDCWIRLKLQLLGTDKSSGNEMASHGGIEHAFTNGVILGKQEGRHVQILNCFPMPQSGRTGMAWNAETYHQCVEHFRVVSSQLMVMGAFFCTATSANVDLQLFSKVTSNLLPQEGSFVLLLESQRRHLEQLPLTVLCPLTSTVNTSTTAAVSSGGGEANERTSYISVDYTIMTDESERLVVDELMQTTVMHDDRHNKSQVSAGLQSASDAIQMMQTRMQALLAYVVAVRNGELPCNRPLLRQITAICQRLRRERESAGLSDTSSMETASVLGQQSCDVALNTLLCLMTEGVSAMHDVLHKHALLQSEQRRTGGAGIITSASLQGITGSVVSSKKRTGAMATSSGFNTVD